MSNYRASKSGIAADIEKKLEQKLDDLEDEGVPLAIVDWLNAVLDSEADVCEGTEWQDIQEFLKVIFQSFDVVCAKVNLVPKPSPLFFIPCFVLRTSMHFTLDLRCY